MVFETFKVFGLIYNTHSRDFKFFTAPTFGCEMVPAAKPKPKPKPKAAPKQMLIASFLC